MGKILKVSISIIILLLLGAAAVYFWHVDDKVNWKKGKTEDGIYYEYRAGELRVLAYVGDSEELVIPAVMNGRPVKKLRSVNLYRSPEVTIVRLSEGIESIEYGAFAAEEHLKTVYLPESVWYLDNAAFSSCENLEQIVFSEGLTEIGDRAFTGCSSLKEVVLPTTLEKVQINAFANCSSLKRVVFQDSIQYIGEESFLNCRKLETVSFKNTVGYIGDNAFDKCSALTTFEVPEHVYWVSETAFDNTPWKDNESQKSEFLVFADNLVSYTGNLENIVIPDGVRYISAAFNQTQQLREVTLSPGVKSFSVSDLGEQPDLYAVKVPEGVESIDISGTEQYPKLQYIEFQGKNTTLDLTDLDVNLKEDLEVTYKLIGPEHSQIHRIAVNMDWDFQQLEHLQKTGEGIAYE